MHKDICSGFELRLQSNNQSQGYITEQYRNKLQYYFHCGFVICNLFFYTFCVFFLGWGALPHIF